MSVKFFIDMEDTIRHGTDLTYNILRNHPELIEDFYFN